MRSISIFIISLMALPLTVMAADKPANLDQLLEQVKRERVIEQEQNRIRETEFLEARDRQAELLAQAKADLAAEERRTETLNEEFEENEFKLAEQESLLQERSGSLGELFGTVRQMANDSRAVIESSMTSVQYPERIAFLTELSERKQQPSIDELRELWLVLQHEMTHSGKVVQFPAQVITANGEVADRNVTRVGVFTAFSDGKFLRYMPENRNLVELARQPVERLRDLMEEFETSEAGALKTAVVDPTRGAIMALLVQTPNLQERIKQGGWIGYIILILGAIGLLIALIRFVVLMRMEHGVSKQQKTKELNMKTHWAEFCRFIVTKSLRMSKPFHSNLMKPSCVKPQVSNVALLR
jgi:biopolymer transport protein ExbB